MQIASSSKREKLLGTGCNLTRIVFLLVVTFDNREHMVAPIACIISTDEPTASLSSRMSACEEDNYVISQNTRDGNMSLISFIYIKDQRNLNLGSTNYGKTESASIQCVSSS